METNALCKPCVLNPAFKSRDLRVGRGYLSEKGGRLGCDPCMVQERRREMKEIFFSDSRDLCQKIRQLFLCCLYWQAGHKDFVRVSRWTTVDHVLRLLDRMDVLKKSTIEKELGKKYWENTYLQGTFRTVLRISHGEIGDFSDEALNKSRAFLLGVSKKSKDNVPEIRRALRNMQIYITLPGVMRAMECERILTPFVTSEEYLSTLYRYREEFEEKKEAARIAIIRNDAIRVQKEITEQGEEER